MDFRRVLMATTFTGLFLLLSGYVLLRFAKLFGYAPTTGYYVFVIIAGISFIATLILANIYKNTFTNLLHRLASVWLGILAIAAPLLLLEHLLSAFLTYDALLAGYVLLALNVLLVIYSLYNGSRITKKHITLRSHKVTRPYRIAHVSDLHLGPIHKHDYLKTVVRTINELEPDIVMITGDLIDLPAKLPLDLLHAFNDVDVPMYFTTGNHDHYVGIEVLKELLKTTKIRLIDGKTARYKQLCMLGVEDSEDKEVLTNHLPLIDQKNFTILSYHRPVQFEQAVNHGVDLMLCGHTHAGQLYSFRPFIKFEFAYVWGLFSYKGSHLHVTCGSGTWGPPMRLGTRNEITLIEVVSK